VRVTSSQEMRVLNRRFRRQNRATDVLSFPSELPEISGDIAVSAEIAAANAAELGHSTEMELKILILHGLLHLAGYDHQTDAGEMRRREAELRRRFKLPVGLIERTHSSDQGEARGALRKSAKRSSGAPASRRQGGGR